MGTYNVVQFGLGPIGCKVVQYMVDRKNVNIVGAVDIDPDKVGKDVGTVAGLGREIGVPVQKSVADVFSKTKPDIVVHTTGSKFDRVYGQLEEILSGGVNIVSTCEELSFPYKRHPELSVKLDELAKKHGATVLATGINPGFLMDTWPLVMTAVCKEVNSVAITRIQDATSRRIPFQQKIGAGLTKEEFQKKVESGEFGHVGLPESMYMVAAGLNWNIDKIEDTIEPIMLDHTVKSDYITVEPGKAAGLKQTAFGYSNGKVLISMDFQAYLGAPESYDEVKTEGVPPMKVRVIGGTQGDIGTVSIAINAIPRVVEAEPGLKTMKDIPMVICGSSYE